MDLDGKLLNLLNRSILSGEAFELIKLGANPNLLNESGYSLLHLLIFNQRMEDSFTLIKEYKADVNVIDKKGLSPLSYMINENYSIESLIRMIRLGAHPNFRNASDIVLVRKLIKTNFRYFMELLQQNPEIVHIKGPQGTPLQMMLNLRHQCQFTADNYLNMIRCGADPETTDEDGIPLLRIVIQLNNPLQVKELIALSKIESKNRIHYTPKLIDPFICDEGIEEMLEDLEHNRFSNSEIYHLAKYPSAKEQVIGYIKTLNPEAQEKIINLSLKPTSSLYHFFSIQRGWFLTTHFRGSFAILNQMRQEFMSNQLNTESLPSLTK